MTRTAAHVILRDASRVLLVRRRNSGFGDGLWCLPSGSVESNESLAAAACRELMEETGVRVDEADLELRTTLSRWTGEKAWVDVFFSSAQWAGEARNLEPGFASEVRWFELTALPEETLDYVKQVLVSDERYVQWGW